jgi:hypothetical protein
MSMTKPSPAAPGPSNLRYEIRQTMSSQRFRVSGIGLSVGAAALMNVFCTPFGSIGW